MYYDNYDTENNDINTYYAFIMCIINENYQLLIQRPYAIYGYQQFLLLLLLFYWCL